MSGDVNGRGTFFVLILADFIIKLKKQVSKSNGIKDDCLSIRKYLVA